MHLGILLLLLLLLLLQIFVCYNKGLQVFTGLSFPHPTFDTTCQTAPLLALGQP